MPGKRDSGYLCPGLVTSFKTPASGLVGKDRTVPGKAPCKPHHSRDTSLTAPWAQGMLPPMPQSELLGVEEGCHLSPKSSGTDVCGLNACLTATFSLTLYSASALLNCDSCPFLSLRVLGCKRLLGPLARLFLYADMMFLK